MLQTDKQSIQLVQALRTIETLKYHPKILKIKEFMTDRSMQFSSSYTTPFSKFYVKIWVGFSTLENTYSQKFLLKANRKNMVSSKKPVPAIFKIALRLRDWHAFICQSVEIRYLKTKTFSKKLECRFLIGSTKIENASFPCKTAILEANVKANRMMSTKWICHKEWSFARNYFIFSKFLFQFNNLL